jgi:hypothetical protein
VPEIITDSSGTSCKVTKNIQHETVWPQIKKQFAIFAASKTYGYDD